MNRDAVAAIVGAVGLLAVSLIAGCGGEKPVDGAAAGHAVSRSASADSVELKVTVSPAELPFEQKATLVIQASADRDISIELRGYDDLLREAGKQYEIRAKRQGRQDALPQAANRFAWTHTYELEFFLPGEYELPGASLRWFRTAPSELSQGPTGDDRPQELATESLPIRAAETAAAAVTFEELTEIRTLPPVELPEPWRYGWLTGILTLIAVVAAILLIRRRKSAVAASAVNVPAHEWALAQLAELKSHDLIARMRVQEFYYRISGILRGYMERRFGVRAMEMTTEEFLAAAARDPRFASEGGMELDRFLTACDMVKYARYEPEAGQPESLFGIVGEFVERTRVREEPAASGSRQERAA